MTENKEASSARLIGKCMLIVAVAYLLGYVFGDWLY